MHASHLTNLLQKFSVLKVVNGCMLLSAAQDSVCRDKKINSMSLFRSDCPRVIHTKPIGKEILNKNLGQSDF